MPKSKYTPYLDAITLPTVLLLPRALLLAISLILSPASSLDLSSASSTLRLPFCLYSGPASLSLSWAASSSLSPASPPLSWTSIPCFFASIPDLPLYHYPLPICRYPGPASSPLYPLPLCLYPRPTCLMSYNYDREDNISLNLLEDLRTGDLVVINS